MKRPVEKSDERFVAVRFWLAPRFFRFSAEFSTMLALYSSTTNRRVHGNHGSFLTRCWRDSLHFIGRTGTIGDIAVRRNLLIIVAVQESIWRLIEFMLSGSIPAARSLSLTDWRPSGSIWIPTTASADESDASKRFREVASVVCPMQLRNSQPVIW